MEKTKKHLQVSSIVILIFSALALLRTVPAFLFGDLSNTPLPEGAPKVVLLVGRIVLALVTLAFLAPQFYVGVKGLRMAKAPNASKAHIVWAVILLVFGILSLLDPVLSIVALEKVAYNVGVLTSTLIEVIVYFFYIKSAGALRKAA